jgi:hypothetical protein
MAYTVPQLLEMSRAQLDEIFGNNPAGEIPDGPAKGTAIIASGTKFSQEIAEFVNIFGWQGKTFDAKKGLLKNRISVLHIEAIVAKVYKGTSWYDKNECIILDYSDTSLVAHYVRDEIRLIAPNFYLGRVYWKNTYLIHFCLEFGAAAAQ